MADLPATDPWDWLYVTRGAEALGWFEPDPTTSRRLVLDAVERGARSVVDVGGGASRLVDALLDLGLERLAVLDISAAGLAVAQHRLGARAERVEWIAGDVRAMRDLGRFDVWHDRAAFHFLLEDEDREAYVRLAERTIPIGGTAIIATFAEDGPERCSGMPVHRYDPDELARELGGGFRLTDSLRHQHHTPAGVAQRFRYAIFDRVDPGSADASAEAAPVPAAR